MFGSCIDPQIVLYEADDHLKVIAGTPLANLLKNMRLFFFRPNSCKLIQKSVNLKILK